MMLDQTRDLIYHQMIFDEKSIASFRPRNSFAKQVSLVSTTLLSVSDGRLQVRDETRVRGPLWAGYDLG